MAVIFHDSLGKAINSVIVRSAKPANNRRLPPRGGKKDEAVLLRPKSAIRLSAKADAETHMISAGLRTLTSFDGAKSKNKVTFQVLNFEIVEGGKGRFDPANPFGN